MYSLQTCTTRREPLSISSVPTSQFSRTATFAERSGPRPSSRPPSVSRIAAIIASPPSPSAAIIASPRRMQAETAPTAPYSRRNSTGNGPREASSEPPVAAEAWWRTSETRPIGPARDDLDVAVVILDAADGRLDDVDVGAAREAHAAHRDRRMPAAVGVAVDHGEMRVERVGEPGAGHERARMGRHRADDRAVALPGLARELERAQAVARPRQLPLRARRADAGHDHDLVVALELVERDEHRACRPGTRCAQPRARARVRRRRLRRRGRPCEAARASSKVSSRMPPVA